MYKYLPTNCLNILPIQVSSKQHYYDTTTCWRGKWSIIYLAKLAIKSSQNWWDVFQVCGMLKGEGSIWQQVERDQECRLKCFSSTDYENGHKDLDTGWNRSAVRAWEPPSCFRRRDQLNRGYLDKARPFPRADSYFETAQTSLINEKEQFAPPHGLKRPIFNRDLPGHCRCRGAATPVDILASTSPLRAQYYCILQLFLILRNSGEEFTSFQRSIVPSN